MQRAKSVDHYIKNTQHWGDEIARLVDILRQSELGECVKWGAPCYTLSGKNVVGLGAFKSYFGIWFHQGALLEDKRGLLINAQEGKTQALRQWRMTSAADIKPRIIQQYVREAAKLAKQGRAVPVRRSKPLVIPVELKDAFASDRKLKTSFEKRRPGQQREYAEFISSAKRSETRQRRLTKAVPMIRSEQGLDDQYR